MNKPVAPNPGRTNKLINSKDIMFVWDLLRKNILIIVLVPILTYAIGYIYAYRLVETYGAQSQFLLQSTETYDYQDPIYKGLGAYGAYRDVRNQTSILQSNDLIESVVKKMKANTSYYIHGRLNRKEVFGTLPFLANISVLDSSFYETPIGVSVLNKNEYKISYERSGSEVVYSGYFEEPLFTSEFTITLNRSYPFTDENIGRITAPPYEMIFHSNRHMVNKFKSNLEIVNLENTSVLQLTVYDEIGARAKMFLDTLARAFIDYSKTSQLEVNQNTLDNIDKQIAEVVTIIKDLENQLILYKNKNAILELSMEETEYFEKYVTFSELVRELEHQKASVLALQEYVLKSNDDRILPPSFYIQEKDEYLNNIVKEIYGLQLEISTKQYSVTQGNPNMDWMKAELAVMKSDALIYLRNLKAALDSEVNRAKGLVQEYQGKMKQIPLSLQGLENIQRELDVNNKMYLFLLEKRTSTLIARAGIIPQVRIIEKARSMGVIAPDKPRIRNMFLLGGVVLGLLIAFLRKMFFEKISNVNELADETSMNIIGGIPYIKNSQPGIVVNDMPKAQVTESFRTIRTNISFLGEGSGKPKVILVSSFFPGEGKTFTSSNLAAILAKGDKKVLLMDFDLHKPKVHKMFNIPNQLGISTYIIDKANVADIRVKSGLENLDIMPAGPLAPNPSELVLKQRVQELFEYASKQYDYVIVDTPPFGLLNDSLVLASWINIFLVVSNTNMLRRRGVKSIEEYMSRLEHIDKGIILNGIKLSRLSYYYAKYSYKYAYGYNYGYGYGYGSSGYGYDYSEHE